MANNGVEDGSRHIDERSLWAKITSQAKKAGEGTVEKVLWLYFAAKKPETPAWAKGVIVSALAYFVLPIDAIPDFIPGAGYADDAGALTAAIGLVAFYIDSDVKAKAADKLKGWFG